MANEKDDAVAIIAMGLRVPGATNADEFWQLLLQDTSTYSAINCVNADPLKYERNWVKCRGTLQNIAEFDCHLFGITPKEAALIDPQQRLFLEIAWQTLYNAGLLQDPARFKTGLWVAAAENGYFTQHLLKCREIFNDGLYLQAVIGNGADYLAARVAHKAGLIGPVQTLAGDESGSAQAISLAVTALLQKECDVALAGGVDIAIPQEEPCFHLTPPDSEWSVGHHPYDAKASGATRGHGVGIIACKRLEQAINDGDSIHAIIRGAAIANAGNETIPSLSTGSTAVAMALEMSGIPASRIDYVEGFGSAFPNNDATEIEYLGRFYKSQLNPISLGAHSCITGHLGVASGVVGLIKNALLLQHRCTPGMVGHAQDAPHLFTNKFSVKNENKIWQAHGQARAVALNSFGKHGNHVHIVMEEGPPFIASETHREAFLWRFSGATAQAVVNQMHSLSACLERNRHHAAVDVEHTLNATDLAMRYRALVACNAAATGSDLLSGATSTMVHDSRLQPDVVFLFPGQGSQTPGMAQRLYSSEPVFSDALDACAVVLQPLLQQDIRQLVFEHAQTNPELLNETAVTQPVLFAFEYALAHLWMSWGVKPAAMLGHSLGEYVAACLCGLFDVGTACELVYHRARLMQAQPRGAMLAVRDGASVVEPLIANSEIVIAGYNSPQITVVAGDTVQLEELITNLDHNDIGYKRLATSHAFHSPMMSGALPEFRTVLEKVNFLVPEQRWISCVSGTWIDPEEVATADYWLRQLTSPVRFAAGIELLSESNNACFLEVGPGRALTSLALQQNANTHPELPGITSLAYDPNDDSVAMLTAAGTLWALGVLEQHPVWEKGGEGQKIPLPGYSFDRVGCWITPDERKELPAQDSSASKLSPDGGVDAAEQLRNILCSISGYKKEELQWQQTFVQQGFDSLLLTQLTNRITKTFGIPCKLRDVMERWETPAKLLVYLEKTQDSDKPKQVIATKSNPIKPQAIAYEWLPLTDAQREIAAVVQMGNAGSAAYNQCLVLSLMGKVCSDALMSAIILLCDRHDALRTRFNAQFEQQKFSKPIALAVDEIDLTDSHTSKAATTFAQLEAEQIAQPFDLVSGPLVRATLVYLPEQCVKLIFVSNHIVYDGWSSRLFFQELAALYSAAVAERSIDLPPAVSFSDHIALEQLARKGIEGDATLHYWKEQFAEVPEPLELPTDHPRPPIKTYNSARVVYRVDITSQRLAAAAATQGATPVAFLLTAFQVLLGRISRQYDVVVGLPISVRDPEVANTQMGHATNLLPMRLSFDLDMLFSERLEANRKALLDAQDHKLLTFGSLLTHLNMAWSPDRTPLVTAMFNLDRGRQCPEFSGCEASLSMPERPYANFEIELQAVDLGSYFQLETTYNRDLFDVASVTEWLESYHVMLQHLIEHPETRLGSIPMISQGQLAKLQQWNATHYEYPKTQRLESLILAQAKQCLNKTAISGPGESLTYQQLLNRSNAIAVELRQRGVTPGDFIGVCLERTPDMVAALLAILQCGAAFVPLDPMFPKDRLAYIVANSQLPLVISTPSLAHCHGCDESNTLNLEALGTVQDKPTLTMDLSSQSADSSVAYVLYTSGSTGKPKGVCIPHKAIVNFLYSMAREPGLTSQDKLLAVTTLSFDIAMLELFLPLLMGASIVLASSEESKDATRLGQLIAEESVTVMQATPATWRMMADSHWAGDANLKILCGGEALPPALAEQLLSRCKELWNLYGPTETTVWSTCKRITAQVPLTLGAPINNTSVWVLDEHQHMCPPSVLGEIYIGGDGVALGYHRRPELTQERFIEDPFDKRSGGKLYNTGDIGRWLPRGELEYLGRNDFQVKIRGFRIELGEIEKVLQQHESVHDAVVHTHPAPSGEAQLVAYIIPESGAEFSEPSIEAFLKDKLSHYMLPSFYTLLDKFPLTPNAKVDRKALPAPRYDRAVQNGKPSRPRNDIEVKISELFANRLSLAQVTAEDDFFRLGGNSILAVALINDINSAFDLKLQVGDVFQHPTVATLSNRVEQGGGVLKSMVVTLTQHDNKPPLYFVCGIALYHQLASNLGDSYSCYGVFVPEEQAFLDGQSEEMTIEQLASYYIRAIREHQPEGRLLLCGVSFGGLLAFEMARQLGNKAGGLVILDCILPHGFRRDWWRTFKRQMAWKVASAKLQRLKRPVVKNNAAKPTRNNRNLQLWEALRSNGVRNYLSDKPRCTLPTLLIKAELRPGLEHFIFKTDLGWRNYIEHNLHIDSVVGDHLGILDSQVTASKMRAFLSTVPV